MDSPHGSETRFVLPLTAIFALMAIWAVFGIGYFGIPNFDERAQVSYVFHILAHGIPTGFDGMRLVDPATLRWTAEPNYMVHPPWYFAAMAAVAWPFEPETAIRVMRCVNAAMGIVSVWLLLGWGARQSLGRSGFAVFASVIVLNPWLSFMAGTVTNDNLAFLGGALCLSAMGRTGRLGIGVTLAVAAKLTAGLLCGIYALAMLRRLDRKVAVAAVAIGIVALPYLWYLIEYGSPTPHTAGMKAAADHMFAGARLSCPEFVERFVADFVHMWSPQNMTLSFGPVLVTVLLLAVFAGMILSGRRVALSGLAAIAVTVALHLVMNYRWHVEYGYIAHAYPRYYLPMLGAMALGAAALVRRSGKAAPFVTLFLVGVNLVLSPFAAVF